MVLSWLLLGVALAVPYVAVGARLGEAAWRWWAVGLVAASLVYVGFAVAAGAGLVAVAVEAVGVVGFGYAAWAGARDRNRFTLALAWALHPLWDVGVHTGDGLPAPMAYVWMCLAFDLVVAAAIGFGIGGRRRGADRV